MAIMNTISIQKKIQKVPIVGYVTNDTNTSSTTDAPSIDAMKKYISEHGGTSIPEDILNKINGIESGAQVNKIEAIQKNGVVLPISNKTVNVTVPTKVSQVQNDTGFITNSVSNLTNYYTKTQTYTKTEIDAKIPNKTSILNMVYPVGSIYISINNTNPSTFIGGTWVEFGTGRTIVGVDTSQTEFSTVQKTGGSKELQSHQHSMLHIHTVNTSTTTDGEHLHEITTRSAGAHTHTVSGNTDALGGHSHKANLADTNGSSTISNVPSIQRNAWATSSKKAWQDSQLLINSGVHRHTISGTSNSTGAHDHVVAVGSSGDHRHTINGNTGNPNSTLTANYGSGNSKNLQPYITVYMFKRTA